MLRVLKSPYALACPGQGFVRYGYLAPFANYMPTLQPYLDQLDEALNEKFSQHLLNTDKNTDTQSWIAKTSNAQPAILFTTFILNELIRHEYGIDLAKQATYLMGHSLGEYTALLLSGVLDLPSALKLVRKRGQLMESLLPSKDQDQHLYGMRAYLFPESYFEAVRKIAEENNVLANLNHQQQIVCSGHVDELTKFGDVVRQNLSDIDIKEVPLEVNIPFHNQRLKPLVSELEDYVNQNITLGMQKVPIISNLTGRPSSSSETTLKNTLDDNCRPVQWVSSMQYLQQQGISTIVNMGPGYVLKSINSKYSGMTNVALDTPTTFKRLKTNN
ncbi:malonyl CoA-acyl carrier protein transacylase [Scheffersomyces amazonensis]|uniref:malonyl CoA-acyl carrier protein transacylase n=1 Tax=Scheffersomyces amazonensis TaxID=1078765 RepID=UPI00315CE8A6